MKRDPRIANASAAIVKLADECVAGTVEPAAVGLEIALGLATFLAGHLPNGAASAALREYAARIDAPDRGALTETARELLDVADKGQQFIRTLQLAGFSEETSVTALNNACLMTVARTRGAIGAAKWLRKLAEHTESNAAEVDSLARAV